MATIDHERYFELFRVESREQLAELDASLLAFEHDADPAHTAALFRNTHTIKGMASAMGFVAVERVSHALETLLDRVRAGTPVPHRELVDLLFDGTEVLAQCVNAALAGEGTGAGADDALAGHHPVLQRLESLGDNSGNANSTLSTDPWQGDHTGLIVEVRLTGDCPLKGVRAMIVKARVEALGVVTSAHPPQVTWNDDHFDGAFALAVQTTATPDALEEAIRGAGDVERVLFPAVDGGGRGPDTGNVAADIFAGVTMATRPLPDNTRTVRVDRRRLDALLELVGELVVTRDRLTSLADDTDQSPSRELSKTAHQTARLITALQEEILQTRMVPVGQVLDRFPRLVRDIAHGLGKEVEFVTEGREIELDRALVDALGDPLMHLLRNALDHGLEIADQRRAVGKPPVGRLVVRAARDRAAVVIQVEDDGKGIDRLAIMRRAQAQGLLADSVDTITDDTLLQVLAHPGFSTASKVTSLSGRGVGVDVVATRVRALGGVLELETIAGVGSVFTLRMPVTLAITRALLVQIGTETYALPAVHVVEAVAFEQDLVDGVPGLEQFVLRDERLPLIHLRECFGLPRHTDECYVTVVEVSGRRTALLVDALIAQQDIVVKPYNAVRGGAPWFTGATVLGDGTPALIVDLGSIT